MGTPKVFLRRIDLASISYLLYPRSVNLSATVAKARFDRIISLIARTNRVRRISLPVATNVPRDQLRRSRAITMLIIPAGIRATYNSAVGRSCHHLGHPDLDLLHKGSFSRAPP